MKKSRKNYTFGVLVALLLVVAVGYAAFSSDLVIEGTAKGTGNWDVKFIGVEMSDTNHGTATVNADGDVVTVNAQLGFPGDGCTVTANIKNGGSIPAKLTAFTLTDKSGATYSNENVEVTIPTIAADGSEVIAAGATCPVTFAIKWKTASEAATVDADFKISFTYEQSTTEVNVAPSHGTHQ